MEIIEANLLNVYKIGQIFRRHRRALGLRQAECAELAGVSVGWLSRFENGKTTSEIRLVMAVASVLELAFAVHVRERGLIDEALDSMHTGGYAVRAAPRPPLPEPRPRCGAEMPNARASCILPDDHRGPHRSRR